MNYAVCTYLNEIHKERKARKNNVNDMEAASRAQKKREKAEKAAERKLKRAEKERKRLEKKKQREEKERKKAEELQKKKAKEESQKQNKDRGKDEKWLGTKDGKKFADMLRQLHKFNHKKQGYRKMDAARVGREWKRIMAERRKKKLPGVPLVTDICTLLGEEAYEAVDEDA